MKKALPTLGFVAMLAGNALAYDNTAVDSKLHDLFDRNVPVAVSDLVYRPAVAPAVVVPLEYTEAKTLAPGRVFFKTLRLSIHNSWTRQTTDLTIDSKGQATIVRSAPSAVSDSLAIALSASELQEVQDLWTASNLSAGSQLLGRIIPDATLFTLSYEFCGNGAGMPCQKGSISGTYLMKTGNAALDTLLKKLSKIEKLQK